MLKGQDRCVYLLSAYSFDSLAQFLIERKRAREIDPQEAKDVLNRAEEAGFRVRALHDHL
jgi:hypothetical protein